jgi:hypothetical protein
MRTATTFPEVMSEYEAEGLTQIPWRRLRALARNGNVPYIELPGGRYGFLRSDLAELILSLRRAPAAQPAGGDHAA